MEIIKDKYIKLGIYKKQVYIKLIKDVFERKLAHELDLLRVSAPVFVTPESGLQDDLSGVERRVSFDIKKDGQVLEVVQSLAKWKRYALDKYKLYMHKGIYTDMTAIRRDDSVDATHSIYVDQWDWEMVISRKDRTIKFLKETVVKIVRAIAETSDMLKEKGFDGVKICKDVFFIDSEDLLQMYPGMSDKEREDAIVREHKTVFITRIGDKLSSGEPHDTRAPDYDDWALNGDLLFYHEVFDKALEISSMGIRVDAKSMKEQLEKSGKQERLQYEYHQKIMKGELPLSIGGGIGQSRLCMLLLGRAHIGEVQCSYWDRETLDFCKEHDIELL